MHPSQIADWKRLLLERAADVFGSVPSPAAPAVDLKELHAKIGRLTLEKDFLQGALSKAGLLSFYRWMIDRSHGLSITRLAKLVRISRGTVYYHNKPPCEPQVQLMHSMDSQHVAHPFAGACMLKGLLQRQGHCVGLRYVRTLMQGMCITALYCKPRTSARLAWS